MRDVSLVEIALSLSEITLGSLGGLELMANRYVDVRLLTDAGKFE
jgi:hypothetical protein